jgi:hypothetical protein
MLELPSNVAEPDAPPLIAIVLAVWSFVAVEALPFKLPLKPVAVIDELKLNAPP